MPRRPPRPSHTYLTDIEIQQLGALVHRGARHLPPAECNRLLLLFQRHLGDLQQARRTAVGLREQVNRLRQRAEQAEVDQQERTINAIRRLAARIGKLDPHRHSDYLMGAKNTASSVTRVIDRAARRAQP